jgi:hypothetical protein
MGLDEEPLMAVLYSYFDESGKFQNHDVVSFAGVCGDIHQMEVFGRKWRELLRRIDVPAFKMSDAVRYGTRWSDRVPAQTVSERIKVLLPFVKCFCDHTEVRYGISLDAKAFKDLEFNERKALGAADDPHYVAFLLTVLELARRVSGPQGYFSLICDDEEKTAEPCYRYYRRVKKLNREDRRIAAKKMACIGFADDEAFPPLQAADMFSSLMRLEASRRFFGQPHDFIELLEPLDGKVDFTFADRTAMESLSNSLKTLEDKHGNLRDAPERF